MASPVHRLAISRPRSSPASQQPAPQILNGGDFALPWQRCALQRHFPQPKEWHQQRSHRQDEQHGKGVQPGAFQPNDDPERCETQQERRQVDLPKVQHQIDREGHRDLLDFVVLSPLAGSQHQQEQIDKVQVQGQRPEHRQPTPGRVFAQLGVVCRQADEQSNAQEG